MGITVKNKAYTLGIIVLTLVVLVSSFHQNYFLNKKTEISLMNDRDLQKRLDEIDQTLRTEDLIARFNRKELAEKQVAKLRALNLEQAFIKLQLFKNKDHK